MWTLSSCSIHVLYIGQFRSVKIFIMEIFTVEIFESSTIWKFTCIRLFMLTKITRMKMWDEQKCHASWSTCLNITSILHRFGIGTETRRTFHRGHAASIKTTRLSCKDCLAGHSYEKAAVISEHHTHTHTHTSALPKYYSIDILFQDHSAEAPLSMPATLYNTVIAVNYVC